MSSSVENIENNQENTYALPTTTITSQPIVDFNQLTLVTDPFRYRTRTYNNQQLALQDYAQKEIVLDRFKWTVGKPMDFTFEVTPMSLMQFLKLKALNTFFTFENEFKIKFNTHQYMQGLAVLFFDPAPANNYYNYYFDVPQASMNFHWQLPHRQKFAMDRDVLQFSVPMIYPFNYFYSTSNDSHGEQASIYTFLNTYPMGRWHLRSITNLQTTSPVISIPIMITQRLTNVKYAGNRLQDVTLT